MQTHVVENVSVPEFIYVYMYPLRNTASNSAIEKRNTRRSEGKDKMYIIYVVIIIIIIFPALPLIEKVTSVWVWIGVLKA